MCLLFILVTGGGASGKSEIAENICQRLCDGEKAYIATMSVSDLESEKRVLRHREMRSNKRFDTIECSLCNSALSPSLSKYGAVLLECVSNLLANEMFILGKKSSDAVLDICNFIFDISKNTKNLIVVSNDIFGDYNEFDDFTKEYIKALAQINKSLAGTADVVIEAVYSVPVYIKGDAI